MRRAPIARSTKWIAPRQLLLIVTTGVLLAQIPSPKGSLPAGAQPFGLKGDVLGETLQEFRARNERTVFAPVTESLTVTPEYPVRGSRKRNTQPPFPRPDVRQSRHLPYCSNEAGAGHIYDDGSSRTWNDPYPVVKCVTSLSTEDNFVLFGGQPGDQPTVADIKAYQTVYYFFNEKLYKIVSEFPPSSYKHVRAAFVDKYGEPSASKMAEYQNGFGAKYFGEQLSWDNPFAQIDIGELDGFSTRDPTNSVLLTIWHKALRKDAEAAATPKNKGKDL